MRKSMIVAALAVSAIAAALQCRDAQAGSPFLGGGYFGGGSYSIYSTESIPFYWRYSPVYYSLPVPRTYGYSPYAYPPGVQTPEIIFEEPELMINPYVPREKTSAEPAGRVTSRVKRIQNPFVTASVAEVVVDDQDQASDDLSMLLDTWQKMPAELRAQIVDLVRSAQ